VVVVVVCFVVQGSRELQFWYDTPTQTITVKKPDVKMTSDWDISFD
jgi:hypothetical protein